MITFYADAMTEDGYETCVETEAATLAEAREYFEEAYPDCRIYRVMTAAEYGHEENERAMRILRQIVDEHEYGYLKHEHHF